MAQMLAPLMALLGFGIIVAKAFVDVETGLTLTFTLIPFGIATFVAYMIAQFTADKPNPLLPYWAVGSIWLLISFMNWLQLR